MPTYDTNGNVTNDSNHTYAWDADGNSVTLDSVGLTFDALDRMVEQNRSGSCTEIVYTPTGGKLALMNGQSLVKAFVPLPGGATAVYTSTGLDHYRHSDWLGSARLSSSPSRTFVSSTAYAPYGEPYASSGTQDLSFTGQNSDTSSGDYDFLFREYSTQGRWASPDPAGLAAVNPGNPQSWNRYAYVLDNPLALIDPLGLDPNDGCTWDPKKNELTCPGPPPEPVSSLLSYRLCRRSTAPRIGFSSPIALAAPAECGASATTFSVIGHRNPKTATAAAASYKRLRMLSARQFQRQGPVQSTSHSVS